MKPITIISFGYLHGVRPKADITIDLRQLLSDPAHVPQGDMLDMTGLSKEVHDFVFNTPGVHALTHSIFYLTVLAAQLKPVTLAIGCAGGRHRSVVFAEKISWLLSGVGYETKPYHLHIHLPRIIK